SSDAPRIIQVPIARATRRNRKREIRRATETRMNQSDGFHQPTLTSLPNIFRAGGRATNVLNQKLATSGDRRLRCRERILRRRLMGIAAFSGAALRAVLSVGADRRPGLRQFAHTGPEFQRPIRAVAGCSTD